MVPLNYSACIVSVCHVQFSVSPSHTHTRYQTHLGGSFGSDGHAQWKDTEKEEHSGIYVLEQKMYSLCKAMKFALKLKWPSL